MKVGMTNTIDSNKFYNIEIINNEIIVNYGKIGSSGKTESKGKFNTYEEAFFESCKLMKTKTIKGYRENVIDKNLAYPQLDMTQTSFPILNGFKIDNNMSSIGFDTKYFLQYKLNTPCSGIVFNEKTAKLIYKYFDMFSLEEDGFDMFEDEMTYENFEEDGTITLSSIMLHYNGKTIDEQDVKDCKKYLKKTDPDYYEDLGKNSSQNVPDKNLYVICQFIECIGGLRFDDGGNSDNWIYFESE